MFGGGRDKDIAYRDQGKETGGGRMYQVVKCACFQTI